MAAVFLSPSVQEWNLYLTEGTEEQYMNLVADEVEPFLEAAGIEFGRNDPSQSLLEVIAQSNAYPYDLHIAIHSNASPEGKEGQFQGVGLYYYPQSAGGRRFALLLQEEFQKIYPNPALVKLFPTTSLAEVRRTYAPSVLIEAGFHDNAEDETWIKANLTAIGEAIATAAQRYLAGEGEN